MRRYAPLFAGHYYGNGFEIQNLTIDHSGTSTRQAALFGRTTEEAHIEHVTLVGVSIIGDEYVGGLVGRTTQQGHITDSYAQGNVITTSGHAGGLAGGFYAELVNSYASGVISRGDDAGDIGGLIGYIYFAAEITGRYYDVETSGVWPDEEERFKGYPKTTSDMMQQTTFEGWDFDNIWDIHENESYPFLRDNL